MVHQASALIACSNLTEMQETEPTNMGDDRRIASYSKGRMSFEEVSSWTVLILTTPELDFETELKAMRPRRRHSSPSSTGTVG